VLPALAAVLTVALAGIALAAVQQDPYPVKDQSDARGNSFTGVYDPLADGFVGPVQVVFAAGEVYDGGFAENRFNGYGVFEGESTNDEGELKTWRFEGTFENGRLKGEGSYSDDLGSYEGLFKNSLPDGSGIYRSNSGWRYEGEFLAGRMTGKGTAYLADGSVSKGVFEDGMQVSIG
jgi:hypothetical protein